MSWATRCSGSSPRRLTETIRKNVSIDWTQRESAQAKLRTMVRRLLRKHGYPPDKQEQATQTVMEQAERLCETWAEDGLLEATVTPLPGPRYAAGTPAELPLAADAERAQRPSSPSQGTKPRKPRK
ncbi:type I restriction enzyme endonuclease domain-containing protein [Archangium gephyra]|uniref:type I restriction enzyme endonuclease domain-containing protein n=1 Tax=Archangium gephyra TaxID=48 RepID=UPI003B7E2B54